jgi:hypothetical protein
MKVESPANRGTCAASTGWWKLFSMLTAIPERFTFNSDRRVPDLGIEAKPGGSMGLSGQVLQGLQ